MGSPYASSTSRHPPTQVLNTSTHMHLLDSLDSGWCQATDGPGKLELHHAPHCYTLPMQPGLVRGIMGLEQGLDAMPHRVPAMQPGTIKIAKRGEGGLNFWTPS